MEFQNVSAFPGRDKTVFSLPSRQSSSLFLFGFIRLSIFLRKKKPEEEHSLPLASSPLISPVRDKPDLHANETKQQQEQQHNQPDLPRSSRSTSRR